jgi:hypothetical protein
VIVSVNISTVALDGVSLWLPGRLTEAPEMERLVDWQQKHPRPLHRPGILKGVTIFVCSLLYTFSSLQWRSMLRPLGS